MNASLTITLDSGAVSGGYYNLNTLTFNAGSMTTAGDTYTLATSGTNTLEFNPSGNGTDPSLTFSEKSTGAITINTPILINGSASTTVFTINGTGTAGVTFGGAFSGTGNI